MATTTRKKTQPVVKEADISDVIDTQETVELDLSKVKGKYAKIPDEALIRVRSNTLGQMFYVDAVTREEFTWNRCGEVLVMPMINLRHMKAGANKFFENQMVLITGFADENSEKFSTEDIYSALFITKYYENYIDPTNFGDITQWSAKEIEERVSLMNTAAKMRLVVMLNTYIEKGILDSLRVIRTFEEVLGCDLKMPE